MSVALTDNQTLLAFKAGRSFRRSGTNFVDADPTKGAIVLSNSDDGLLHFTWKERATGNLGDDLILFPGDAIFEKVAQAPGGRTYILRFESSDQKHFDTSSRRDDEFVHNLNRLLADPNIIPVWDSRTAEPEASTSTPGASTSQTPAATAPSGNTTASVPPGMTPEQLARLRALVTSMGANADPNPDDEVSLTDILTPSNLLPLFTSHPALLSSLFPHLPSELLLSANGPLTPQQTAQLTDALERTINSPPFRAAVSQLDRALRTGALGGFVSSLGLPESAGTGIGAFLRAINEQARREGQGGSGQEDRMEED
ncbi:adhesion regulating molecule [Boletus reticuloceps]|uniref:Adhesion regulating molecule n=1 Tax=Boletus reticuloceps TaxID=495285 RepID=A0A8I3ABJ8_9AGAM|nr:adhesion regulating molecule [Boletus reticuloceps]